MSFASTLTKQLCASAIAATFASTSFVRLQAAEPTEVKPAAEAAQTEQKQEEKPAAEKAAKKKSAKAGEKSTVTVSGLEWRTDYNKAYQAAKRSKRMLLINLTSTSTNNVQSSVDIYIATNAAVQKKLQNV